MQKLKKNNVVHEQTSSANKVFFWYSCRYFNHPQSNAKPSRPAKYDLSESKY